MIFQKKFISVFLFVVAHLQLSEGLSLQNINTTLFAFNHPNNCKRNEIYNLDYFLCYPCDPKTNLQPSFDKLTCECTPSSKVIANYDSALHRPICAQPCQITKTNKCRNITSILPKLSCDLKYINFTSEQAGGVAKHIRIYPHSPNASIADCSCDTKYNYIYYGFCIYKELLKNYLKYNSFWHRGNVYADLKFIAFLCQSLQNMTACNHLANLCVNSFFDTEKNSPCSIFLLTQASDATLYSSMGEETRPFLFYKRGKDTTQELEEILDYPLRSKTNRLDNAIDMFTTAYSLEGKLVRWGLLRPHYVNMCGHNSKGPYAYFQYLRNVRIACQLTMEAIIDLASISGNKQFFTVFLNHTKSDNTQYMQTIPVLIENAFGGNGESNTGEWQLVKRFQLIEANIAYSSGPRQMFAYEDSHKLSLFKSIRILRKFELRCTITKDNKMLIPLIVLNYHHIDISLNTSLHKMFEFELIVQFEKERSSTMLYKICLPTFITIGMGFAIFRTYIFKCRRNLEYSDMMIVLQFFLHLMSNIANSFLTTVIIDIFYSMLIFVTRPNNMIMIPLRKVNIFEMLIYSAICLKGVYFAAKYWKTAHIDIFFVDWERPKGYDASLHLKNNLETLSQCSSIRAFTDNNVSAWRIFFVANEWIELSGIQKTSSFLQGFASLTIYWIITSLNSSVYSDAIIELFVCVTIFLAIHMIQRIVRNLILNPFLGNPLQKLIDICTMANVSIFILLDSSSGFYIHGRSPHGFSDTDISSMILQLQRESQNMCGKRGLLSDSDFQTYIILPPLNLRMQLDKLLLIRQKSENVSQVHFQKEIGSIGSNFAGTLEKNSMAYNRVNRFFCAFIDHAIKDMDYIIKEKSFLENLLDCEFESFLGDNKGTFYIDSGLKFGTLFLYGNPNDLFVIELLLLIAIFLLTDSFITSIITVCISNMIFQKAFAIWARNNVARKTLIDKRFLM